MAQPKEHCENSVFQLYNSSTNLLKNFLWRSRSDEAVDVDVDEGGHQELAVEPIHDAAVARNDIAEILKQIYLLIAATL